VPLGFSLDHVGPLARSAWDCGAVLQAIAGYDPLDPDCSERPVGDYFIHIDEGIEGLKVGVARGHHLAETPPEVVLAFEAAVAALAELGAEISEVTLPLYPEVVAATMITIGAEACAYHQRDLATRWTDYTVAARRVFALGALVSGSEYVQAQRVRRLAQRKLSALLSHVDVVMMLTSSVTAPLLDDVPRLDLGNALYTSYWDAVGNPVMAIPIGFANGMPVGMQLAASPFAEDVLLRAGRAYQHHTGWHLRLPDLEASRG
jgi:aspartyl-tRNA(Asn)/glutamyl-tRNA(Gln) amidotransferase subunit A